MIQNVARRYLPALDAEMRSVVDTLNSRYSSNFDVMLRFPLGWVDEHNQPYHQTTGKRLRPILMLIVNEAAGGAWENALPAAAAVELLHNFSLIHDDIQDNSPTRHGRPTVWKIWGIANAINAGDALFSLAYTALERLTQHNHPPEIILKVWHKFNNTNLELTRGQHLDMQFERLPTVTVDEYISMISGKSAALLAACAHIGSLLATQNDEIAEHFDEFGLNIGIAFQIRDDILGIWGQPEVTGKSAATDILSRKKSLPVLYGLNLSDELAHIYSRESFGDNEVRQAISILDQLHAQAYAREKETIYYDRAWTALEKANPSGEAAEWLQQFVNVLFQRAY